MARSLNRVTLLGNVGRDPDVQSTAAGTKVAHLSLATNRRVKGGDGEQHERTDWHRITVWNRLAEFVEEHVQTGDRILVEGAIEYDTYERNGVTIPTAEIVVRELILLTPRPGGGGEASED